MSQPKAATTTSKGRTYGLELPPPDGHKNLWSITTIIKGGLPAPALISWGIWAVARYAVANVKRLYAMWTAAEGDEDAVDQVVKWLGGSPYREKTAKAEIGSFLHAVAQAKALQKPEPKTPEALTPLLGSLAQFEADWQPVWEMSEATVYNVAESIAGTLDGIGRFNGPRVPAALRGKLLLADYKTGGEIDLYDPSKDRGIYPEAALQMAAYRHCSHVYLAPGTVAPMPQVEGAVVIHVTAQGYRVHPVETGEQVWRAFRFVREVFRFQEELAKSVIGEPYQLEDVPATRRGKAAA
jgi:hypothetical protein